MGVPSTAVVPCWMPLCAALCSPLHDAEIRERKEDKDFMQKWSDGDRRAADEFTHLNERAFPERSTEE